MTVSKNDRIYIAGHRGMVGSAIQRRLAEAGYGKIVVRTHDELDLLDQAAVREFFVEERPAAVVLSAARVGGIKANMTYPAEFLYENLQIQNNVIWQAHRSGVKKLLFLGSSCIYPRGCPQPMKEEYLLDGKPEPTNEGYAIAKIAGMKLCEKIYDQFGETFISCMPTNIYGPGDNFDSESSHVIPALLRRFHEAREKGLPEVVIWGSGVSRREFLHVDDLAAAVQFLLESYDERDFLNVGTGEDISIKELALMVRDLVGYQGQVTFDTTKPDGMPKKLLDVSRINALGWRHRIGFEQGLKESYEWYLREVAVHCV